MEDVSLMKEGSLLKAAGVFHFKQIRDGKVIDEWDSKNLVVDEGLSYILASALNGVAAISTWYIGLFKGVYTPAAAETGATVSAAVTEVVATTDVDETIRPTWSKGAESGQSVTNATPVDYNVAATFTAYGAFIISDSAMAGVAGTLLCVSNFDASRPVAANDTLQITYTIEATSV